MAKRYRLVKAHHPRTFEREVYAVYFVEQGKPLVDRYTKFFQVKARSRTEAIKKARQKL